MGVIEFKEIHDGRDSDTEIQSGRTIRRYTRVWRAKTDSNYTEGAEVEMAAPAIGTAYPWDAGASLRRRRARNESFSKKVWIVTGLYSTEREISENPLDDRAEIEWSTDNFQRVFWKDRDGKGIVNSAGDPFDPPVEDDDPRWTVSIKKNLAAVPSWILTYRNAVNSDAVWLDGVYFAAGQLKVSSIRIGTAQQRNDINYRVLTLTFHANSDGWSKSVLDHGFRWKNASDGKRYRALDDAGKPTVHPVLLDGSGEMLADPSPETAVFLTFNLRPSKPFSVLPLS